MFRRLTSASLLIVVVMVVLLSSCSSPNDPPASPPQKTYKLTILSTYGGGTVPSGAVAVEPGAATHVQPSAISNYDCPACLTLVSGTATISGFSVTLNDGDATVLVDWIPHPPPPYPAQAAADSFKIFHGATDVTAGFEFGSQIVLSRTTETFTLQNNTPSTVILPATAYTTDLDDFIPCGSGSYTEQQIAPGGTVLFDIWFIPAAGGTETATLYVNSNIGAAYFPVQGTGTASGTDYLVEYYKNGTTWTTVNQDDSIAFPVLSSGSPPASILFRITNTGSGPLCVPTIGQALSIRPNTAQVFGCMLPPIGTMLALGNTAEFSINAMYKGAGSFSETVTVKTSSATHPAFVFKVTDTQS